VKTLTQHHGSWRAARNTFLLRWTVVLSILLPAAIPLTARIKDNASYGDGLVMTVPFSENEVAHVVEDVAQSGIIRGTKEYNKDEYVGGAIAVNSTKVFPEKPEAGSKVYYKVRLQALDPRNFKNSSDLGTLAVRYVIKAQNEKNTTIRIDARFAEDFRRTVHASNGSVESEEYKVIHDHLEELELAKAEALEVKKSNDAEREQKNAQATAQQQSTSTQSSSQQPASQQPMQQEQSAAVSAPAPTPAPVLANVPSAAEVPGAAATLGTPAESSLANAQPVTIEERVKQLRLQVERKVKSPGAPLKSAPFHSASNLKSLMPGTEVLIVISTTYWLGVETHDGQHGWMLRDDLEPIE
jgi:hypothetical protein